MLTRYTIMRPERPHEGGDVDWPRAPGYDRLKALLTPLLDGNLEHVSVLADFAGGDDYQRADMFVDAEGQLKRLPRNEAATMIYRRATLLRASGTDPDSLPCIVGPAILFERQVWF